MVGDETGASSVSIGLISTHESAIDHVGTHSGGLIEAVQMCTYNVRFHIWLKSAVHKMCFKKHVRWVATFPWAQKASHPSPHLLCSLQWQQHTTRRIHLIVGAHRPREWRCAQYV